VITEIRRNILGMHLAVVHKPEQSAGQVLAVNWSLMESMFRSEREKEFQRLRQRQRWISYKTIYDALFATYHILANYGVGCSIQGEIQLIQGAQRAARKLAIAILTKRSNESISALRAQREQAIAQIAAAVKTSRSLNKTQVREKLQSLGVDVDKLGRKNLPAKVAEAMSVDRLLRQRLEDEIYRIDPHIAKRQRAILHMIKFAEAMLSDVRSFLEQWNVNRGSSALPLYEDRRIHARYMRVYAQDLRRIDYNPYSRMVQLTAIDLERVAYFLEQSKITSRDMQAMSKHLMASWVALAIMDQQKILQAASYLALRNYYTDPSRFRRSSTMKKLETVLIELKRIKLVPMEQNTCDVTIPLVEKAQRVIPKTGKITRQMITDFREKVKAAAVALCPPG